MKSNSLIVRTYLDSPFFYMSLLISGSFLFVQNAERANEIFLKFDNEEPVNKERAGVALLHYFYDLIKKMPDK